MRKLVLTVLALPTLLITSISLSAVASVDCNKNTLLVHTVCNDEEFAELYYKVDKEDRKSFKNTLEDFNASTQEIEERGTFIRTWINCEDKECLKKTYALRLEQLINFNAKFENKDGINFKNLQLGMNKDAIPSKIKLIKGSKMSGFDDAFEFTDGNHNKIDIYGMSFDVKFVIRGDNTVKCITYTAKEAKDISENTLFELSKVLTSKSLKKRMINNYQNGLLSTIILENTEINKGIKDDFRIIYGNENASFNKNEIIIQLLLEEADAKAVSENEIATATEKDIPFKMEFSCTKELETRLPSIVSGLSIPPVPNLITHDHYDVDYKNGNLFILEKHFSKKVGELEYKQGQGIIFDNPNYEIEAKSITEISIGKDELGLQRGSGSGSLFLLDGCYYVNIYGAFKDNPEFSPGGRWVFSENIDDLNKLKNKLLSINKNIKVVEK